MLESRFRHCRKPSKQDRKKAEANVEGFNSLNKTLKPGNRNHAPNTLKPSTQKYATNPEPTTPRCCSTVSPSKSSWFTGSHGSAKRIAKMPHMAFRGLGLIGAFGIVVVVLDFAGFRLKLLDFRAWGFSPVVVAVVTAAAGVEAAVMLLVMLWW